MRFVVALAAIASITTCLAQTGNDDRKWVGELTKPGGDVQGAFHYFSGRGAAAAPTLCAAIDTAQDSQSRIWLYQAAAGTKDPKVLPHILRACGRKPYAYLGGDWKEIPFVPVSIQTFGAEGIPYVLHALGSPNVLTRRVAAQLLWNARPSSLPTGATALLKRARQDSDAVVAVIAANATISTLKPSDYKDVARFTSHPAPKIRLLAIGAALAARPDLSKAIRLQHLSDPDELIGMQLCAIPLRAQIKASDYEALAKKLSTAEGHGRAYVINVLGYLHDARAIPLLDPLRQDPDQRVAAAAENAIFRIQGWLH